MNCATFTSWLENRDNHDLSESDRAIKHAAQCSVCKSLLQKDEELDLFITKLFRYEKLDEQMYGKIDSILATPRRKAGIGGGIAALLATAVAVVLLFYFNPGPSSFTSIDELGKYVVQDHHDHSSISPLFEEIADMQEWGQNNLHYPFKVDALPLDNMKIVGGRICTIKNCNFAHLLYRDKDGIYSLFVVSGDEVGFYLEPGRIYSLTVDGVQLRIWQKQQMVYTLTG